MPSTGGYYIFPDFEVVRESLKRRGLLSGNDMCEAMFKEARIAVRMRTIFLFILEVMVKI